MIDRNTTTVNWVTDGYNSSLVTFSLGIAVAIFTFIALAIILAKSISFSQL